MTSRFRTRQYLNRVLRRSPFISFPALKAHLESTGVAVVVARPAAKTADADREATLNTCIKALNELPFSADDLRFLLTLITMAWGTPPAALLERLRDSSTSDSSQAGAAPDCAAPGTAPPG